MKGAWEVVEAEVEGEPEEEEGYAGDYQGTNTVGLFSTLNII